MRAAVLALGVLGLLSLTASVGGHVTSPDDCDASGSPPMVGGNLDGSTVRLRWESDAAELDNGIICFDRFVRNRHRSQKLIFDWPPGSMAAPNGILPETEMHYNARFLARGAIIGGPLHYGTGTAPPLDTQVYRETSGKNQAPTLASHISFWAVDEAGMPVKVDIIFTSSVILQRGTYAIRYAARNKTTTPALFVWTSARSEVFDKELSVLLAANNQYRFDPIKDAIRVPAEGTFAMVIGAAREPEWRAGPTVFFSKSGKLLALTPGLALVPTKAK